MPTCGTSDAANLLDEAHLRLALSGERPAFALPGDRPRYAPDRPADVRHVDIDVTLDFDRKRVRGAVTTHFTTLFEQVREVTLDAAELRSSGSRMARQEHRRSPIGARARSCTSASTAPTTTARQFGVRVRYTRHAAHWPGLRQPQTPGNPDLPTQAWTQGETEYHHFWFPCHDFPNDRATTALTATVPAAFFALSNGKLEGVTRERRRHENLSPGGMDVPYPAYLITLVAGEFTELPDTWRDMPVNYYVRPGREDDGHRMLDNTPAMIDLFSAALRRGLSLRQVRADRAGDVHSARWRTPAPPRTATACCPTSAPASTTRPSRSSRTS